MQTKNRLEFIDATRGLMMVLMALDHTRNYFSNIPFLATDELNTNAILFFSRWITHLCAPVFIFLVGISTYFALQAGKPKAQLCRFLITRGLWLIVIGCTLMPVVWTFTLDFSLVACGVLGVTGAGMILLALFLYLPPLLTLSLSLGVLLLHNILDGHETQYLGAWNWLHLVQPFTLNLLHTHIIIYTGYVIIPWIVVPGLGFAFAHIYALPKASRVKLLVSLGAWCLAVFLLLRYTNLYGDPHPWLKSLQAPQTLYSFMNISKNPPSLLYFLSTLGLCFFILLFFEQHSNKVTRLFADFGKVPFAFYILHILLIHSLALSIAYLHYGPIAAAAFIQKRLVLFDPAILAPYGYNLGIVFLLWIFILILMTPLCKWYGTFKHKKRTLTWLSYF